ncbi:MULTISPECIES: DUF2069 domain-containing protein [Massilia]|jgi:uncharacterized membrane protein|uniref:DUF2069 domain-containing protein n=2 Tax=Massilia TaxID=149698 RepID=A0A7X3G297_9BURK|nr:MULTISPECIES: DUF2069 domain-containing protein [Telluria group]KQY01600.1 hypothetical protein ASD28_08880 [Massilia sp. Root133]KQZ48142.1 hypothetical protein ASD92_21650 [Massilia sp. Root1485]MDN4043048.1 DUF2069 domain-containing protein [Massilia sp. YIM B02787]MVW62140.1 DUF2069 domain-containing protein [Telluria cellulosilytica]
MQTQRAFHTGAVTSLVILFAWLLVWEIVVAPLHPGGSLLALKALPLLLPLRGVLKRDLYTLQWSSMVILIYFVEGIVRAWSDKTEISRMMALGEALLVVSYFLFALLYLRPYKKQAQKLAKELLDKVKVPHD